MNQASSPRITRTLGLVAVLAGAVAARADTTNCTIGYPFQSGDPRTNVPFNESTVLRAFSPQGTVTATPGLTIKVWYNDEHALVLGVRRVVVKTSGGTTTTDYPVSPLSANPGSVSSPQVGTTAEDGDQAGTDTASCSGSPDLCDRPMWPALFITDITSDPNSTAGDWQAGGTPIAPHAVFGTWKGAVKTVDKTKSPATSTVTPDADPAKNSWDLGAGDPPPAGLKDEGYGAEVRWNVDDLVAAGQMIKGRSYRLQFMVHDGDQNQTGGDAGENCVNVEPAPCTPDTCGGRCTTAADCDDGDPNTTDICTPDGTCEHRPNPTDCKTDGDCDDHDPCTIDQCGPDGSCRLSAIPGCRSCASAADCNDQNHCTDDTCTDGVCSSAPVPGCPACAAPGACSDPGCQAAPQCTPRPGHPEVCGDGIDNDGDGLVDFEDPDCCAQVTGLAIRNMMLKPVQAKHHRKDLRLRARFSIFTPAGFDPMREDTTLQISDDRGLLFEHTIPASHWASPRAEVFRFGDQDGTQAGGIYMAGFRIKRDGRIVFRTLGKQMALRPTDGRMVRVTVRLGDLCAQTITNLRQKRAPRVFRHFPK